MESTTSQLISEKVPFELNHNLIVIDVGINGETRPFILDTGASMTVIAESAARELQLEEAEVQPSEAEGCGLAGSLKVSAVRVKTLSVGAITFNELTCMSTDLESVNKQLGKRVSGVLGFDFLSRFKVTIDYRASELVFEPYGGAGDDSQGGL